MSIADQCDYPRVQRLADAAATRAGINLDAYDQIAYFFPANDTCGWVGLADTARRVWINGLANLGYVAIHELGHNFQLCSDASGAMVSLSDNCYQRYEYADPWTPMGTAVRHFGAGEKDVIGWLPDARIRTVTTQGTYTFGLKPIERALAPTATTAQAVKIPYDADTNVYVEWRQPIGFDADPGTPPTKAMTSGVKVSLQELGSGSLVYSRLVDATPTLDDFTAYDGLFKVGTGFTDPSVGLTVQVLGRNGFGDMVVRIAKQ